MTRSTPELLARLAVLLDELHDLALELRRRHGEDAPTRDPQNADGDIPPEHSAEN